MQWVTVVQKICPTDGLWVSWPAQLVPSLRFADGQTLVHKRKRMELELFLEQMTESGIPPPFRATVWYSRIHLGF